MDWLRYLLLYGPEFAPIASVAAAAVLLTLTQPEGLIPETSRRRWFAVGTLVFIVLAWRPITEGTFFVLCMVGALPWLYWFTRTHEHQRLNSFRDWVIVLGAVVTLVGSQVFLHEVDYMRVSAGETSIRALHSSEAAELRFEDYSTGEQRRLSDYRGKVVVLDFWRPSCFVCVEQMSILDVLFDQYGAEGLVVIHVAAWERDRAMTYVAQNQRDTVYGGLDGVEQASSIFTQIGRPDGVGLPQVIVIDREGVIRSSFTGGVLPYTQFAIGVIPYL